MRTKTSVARLSVLAGVATWFAMAGWGWPAERLDRGLVAILKPDRQTFLSWRWLLNDRPDTRFDVYRSAAANGPWQRLNPQPIADTCAFVDKQPPEGPVYYRLTITAGPNAGLSRVVQPVKPPAGLPFLRLPLRGNYRVQKVGLADLNGDGALDFVIKQPDFNVDPYQHPGYWKKSQDTYKIEAYRHDGKFLWRYDMGWAIEEGIWYSPIVVYDLDGDGKAEVYTKAGEGDPRDPDGKVTSGPEWLVKLDGETGRVLARIPWPSRDGFRDYNYYCRNFLAVAYLDGRRPHLIVERGTYGLIKLLAYSSDLKLVWRWQAEGEYASYRGQGAHGLHAADIDGDGRDELLIGAAAIDDNGRPLWNTRLGHPDCFYVTDIDPAHPGLEIFYGIEPRRSRNGVCLVEARTGKILWGYDGPTRHVHSQGMVGDITAEHPGLECYAGEKDGSNYWLYSADGKRLSDKSLGELAPRAVYWQGGATKAIVSRGRLFEYPDHTLGRIEGRVVAIADCLGDWREEIITSLPGEIRIYMSTEPAGQRRTCLMQDRQYRTDVAAQTMGYFYPPQLGGLPLP